VNDLPRPAFSTVAEIDNGIDVVGNASDTTVENVEKAVPAWTLVSDSNIACVRYLKSGDDLIYCIFRGAEVPERFWGTGEFGLCVLSAVESSWPYDDPKVEFIPALFREEGVADDPRSGPAKYPDYFYGGYRVEVKNALKKPVLTEEKIEKLSVRLEEAADAAIAKWSNGS